MEISWLFWFGVILAFISGVLAGRKFQPETLLFTTIMSIVIFGVITSSVFGPLAHFIGVIIGMVWKALKARQAA